MKSKYEISVWEDILSDDNNYFGEQKIIIIGSDTMTSENRAREPKMINNINGTNKFTFNMYYSYIDTQTGERVKNPYINLLINERKIKVLWKDKWYDLLIKQIKEDQVNHVFSYTCEDAFITELSRTGFNLTFATELENNIGTAKELVEQVIKDTDWQFDESGSDIIYQETEEPVYEVTILNNFSATKDPNGTTTTIKANYPALVYYSFAPDGSNLKTNIQFYYSGTSVWQQDQNDMLVINGNSYSVTVSWSVSNNIATASYRGTRIFSINLNTGLSTKYRAKRYVQSQKTIYSNILDRYVNVYNNGTLLGYESTEFNDALAVNNLVANASNFSNTSGWIGTELYFKISPAFNKNTTVSSYTATSFLYLKSGKFFNTGIQNNRSYAPNGFTIGEYYIFRVKLKRDGTEPANTAYVTTPSLITPSIQSRNSNYAPTGTYYFNIQKSSVVNDYDSSGINHPWLEYRMVCIKSCPYEMILSSSNPFGIFIDTKSSNYWLEEAQFYKEVYGNTGYDDDTKVRINPGEMNLQSISQSVWKYFKASQASDVTKDTLVYDYISLAPWVNATPVYNNYEKYATIEADNSNRFNILQTIAESFECWVYFEIEHDDNGYILHDSSGAQKKYVRLKRESGQETGIGFIYGIDLKSIVRNIKSDKISTKTIVEQNENEFGKNGFCSIARSEQNYPRENFIYNFDYYIQQGLLDKNALYDDLYNVGGMAYYSHLHSLNVEYAENLESLTNKKLELTKQTATAKVYNQYILSSKEELQNTEESLMKLAGVTTITAALNYAKSHANDTKVQALIDDRTHIQKVLSTYQLLNTDIQTSLTLLSNYITELNTRQTEIINELTALNKQFYTKYSRFIQEGTWTSEDYWDDDLYYLDALQVAYTSSRPQISYEINVMRLSDLDDYSSKVFQLGDISFIQDTEYFGYCDDKITPYKEKVVLTEITSYFDTPDKDVIKVQNYKNQFDDLFQRITAAVQNLELSQGKYAKAANIVNTDGTIRSSVIQNTFNDNKDLVYGAQNESATIDNTGITVVDNTDASKQVKITSGGVFVTSDAGTTWKNAIRGDGISTDLLTAGKINTEQITVYNGDYPSFRWDPNGLNAYKFNSNGSVDTTQFVRFDQYGIYGIQNASEVYVPSSEAQIYQDANFGLTWTKFFMKSVNGDKSIEISTDRDIVVESNGVERVIIGRVDGSLSDNYGIRVKNESDEVVFQCDNEGSYLSGWTLTESYLESETATASGNNIRIYADGNIGCYAHEKMTRLESVYTIGVQNAFTATGLNTSNRTFAKGTTIYPFVSTIGKTKTQLQVGGAYNSSYMTPSSQYIPSPPSTIQIAILSGSTTYNYNIENITWSVALKQASYNTRTITIDATKNPPVTAKTTTYTYTFNLTAKKGSTTIFTIPYTANPSGTAYRYIPASDTKWLIDNNGDAIFHEIMADGGQIAGWWIDNEKIYQTVDGSRTGTIKTQLNSAGSATGSDGFDYSIITDAINAAMANIGGVLMSSGLINGYDIANVSGLASEAYSLAASAYGLASTADTAAANAMSQAVAANRYAISVNTSLNNHLGNGTAHYHTHYANLGLSGTDSQGGSISGSASGGTSGPQ